MSGISKTTKILVWDAPTRMFHWLLALCFAGAYVTAESDRLIGVHLTLGYTMLGLVIFRLAWGLVGTRYARFANFVRGPKSVVRYVGTLLSSRSEHPVGHNPLGAVSILLMLLSTGVVVATGWLYFDAGAHAMKEVHESAAGLMLAVVAVHVAAVVFGSLMGRENLVKAMVNGHKTGQPCDKILRSWWPVALLMLAGVLGFWFMQWQGPPMQTQGSGGYVQSDGLNWRSDSDDD